MNLDDLRIELNKFPEVLKYFPPRYETIKNVGKVLKFPNRQFCFSIFRHIKKEAYES